MVSFSLALQHDQEGSGSKKRCVIDALSRSLPTASRKLLPTENEFRQTRLRVRARAPASPADFECMEHPPSRRLFHISGWKNNGDVHAELRQKQSLQLWGLFFTLFPFENKNTHRQHFLFGTKHPRFASDAPVIIFFVNVLILEILIN